MILLAWDQTWSFDGTTWTQLVTVGAPAVRQWPAMVYDPIRDRILEFGGIFPLGGDSNQTWSYQWQSTWPDETCDNGADDDNDGLVDCLDPDCEDHFCATGRCSAGSCQQP